MSAQILGSMIPVRHRAIAVVVSSLLAWGCGGNDGSPGEQSGIDGGGTTMVHDSGASGDAGAGQAGMAVAKFCNGLGFPSGAPLDFTLEIGAPPIRIVAGSGKCTPPAGQPCLPIPAGNVTVSMFRMDKLIQRAAFMIPAGSGMMFQTNYDNDMAGFEGAVIAAGSCPGVDLVPLPGATDAGSPP
jgi:hypothetical protein